MSDAPDLGPDYAVTVTPGGPTPDHVHVVVDHSPTGRRKSGTTTAYLAGQMAACLRQDIEIDLRDVEDGVLPATYGVFAR